VYRPLAAALLLPTLLAAPACGPVRSAARPPTEQGEPAPPPALLAEARSPVADTPRLALGPAAAEDASGDAVATNEATAPLPLDEGKAPPPTHDVPRSSPLPNGLYNPMPGGVMAGYRGDTGLDIAGNRQPVYAIAAGTLDYSEPGHTLWTGPGDTANTVRLRLDEPIPYRGRRITHVWYAHLSALQHHQPEGAAERIRIAAGEQLGISGVANGSPHLHLGLLLDDDVTQYWGTYLLEDQVREVLGGYRHRQRLPGMPAP